MFQHRPDPSSISMEEIADITTLAVPPSSTSQGITVPHCMAKQYSRYWTGRYLRSALLLLRIWLTWLRASMGNTSQRQSVHSEVPWLLLTQMFSSA
jgi:hypothetical protein